MESSNVIKFGFLFFLIILSTHLSAQIEEGTISLVPDTRLSVVSSSDLDFSTLEFSIGLSPSYYIKNNLAISPSIGFGYERTRGQVLSWSRSSLSLGGRITYMIPLSKRFYIPTIIEYGYAINSSDFSSSINTDIRLTSTNSYQIGFGAGIEYLVAERLGLRFSLKNSLLNFEKSDESRSVLAGFIGFNIYFKRTTK